MQGGDKTRPSSSKVLGPALSQKKGICEAELSTCPILVKPMAKGFTERKDLCPQLNWQLLDGEGSPPPPPFIGGENHGHEPWPVGWLWGEPLSQKSASKLGPAN